MEITLAKQQEGQEFYQNLVQKAWEDSNFKKNLVQHPVETLGEWQGKKMVLPESLSIVVEDQTDPDVIYLNIPRKIDVDEVELTEEQLELVSGGIAPLVVYGAIFLGGMAVAAIKEATR